MSNLKYTAAEMKRRHKLRFTDRRTKKKQKIEHVEVVVVSDSDDDDMDAKHVSPLAEPVNGSAPAAAGGGSSSQDRFSFDAVVGISYANMLVNPAAKLDLYVRDLDVPGQFPWLISDNAEVSTESLVDGAASILRGILAERPSAFTALRDEIMPIFGVPPPMPLPLPLPQFGFSGPFMPQPGMLVAPQPQMPHIPAAPLVVPNVVDPLASMAAGGGVGGGESVASEQKKPDDAQPSDSESDASGAGAMSGQADEFTANLDEHLSALLNDQDQQAQGEEEEAASEEEDLDAMQDAPQGGDSSPVIQTRSQLMKAAQDRARTRAAKARAVAEVRMHC